MRSLTSRLAGRSGQIRSRRLVSTSPEDRLTGLLDRQRFIDLLIRCQSEEGPNQGTLAAVLILDLGRFRAVNIALGHELGDRLLVAICRRVEGCLPQSATLARCGGARLAVLLERLAEPEVALEIATRIQDSLHEPFELESHEIFVSLRLGLAQRGASESWGSDLLRDAETAVFHAKQEGTHLELFHPDLRSAAVKRFRLENELRRAWRRNEFELAFQPILSLESRKVSGFEALLRWRHPQRGLLCPRDFLAVAIEMGMIQALDPWILRQACSQLATWRKLQPHRAEALFMTVNLTAQGILDPELPERIDDILASYDLRPQDLKLELTEWTHLEPSPELKTAVTALQKRGIGLFLDDFGTGYSGLEYLHHVPSEALKIDRSFIAGLGNDGVRTRVVEILLRLARELNLTTVAEGVENADQWHQLVALGCDYAQGFFLGEPTSGDAVARYLETGVSGKEISPAEEPNLASTSASRPSTEGRTNDPVNEPGPPLPYDGDHDDDPGNSSPTPPGTIHG